MKRPRRSGSQKEGYDEKAAGCIEAGQRALYLWGNDSMLVCGDSSPMVEVEQFRDRPDAVDEVRAYMVGVFKINEPYPRCRTCRSTNVAFSVNTFRSTDYRRLWALAFVLVVLAAIGSAG